MKKIMFTLLLFIVLISNSHALSKFFLGEKVPNMYIEEYYDNNLHNGAPYVLKREDGAIIYCINPFEYMSTTDYYQEYTFNDPIFNLSDDKLDKINLISYYGYNYYNHTDIKWYGITQFLIWKTIGFNDIYFTDSHYGDRIDAYEEEIRELEELVDKHYLLPSFSNNHYEYSTNSNYKIVDLNNSLTNYEILETNIDATIINNELNINTKEDGDYEIKFIRKSPIDEDCILYGLSGSQSLIYPGKIKDVIFNITIEVNSGSVTVNKFDSENKKYVDATLKGAIYGLYNDSGLITTIETNDLGVGYVNNLPLGKYYIKEITPSTGYELDTNIYYIDITKENKNIVVNSYENIIKGNLVINKYYGEEDNYKLESGALFELYDKNNNKIDIYETENGLINKKLAYGDYYLLQVKGIKGYKFIDKLNISIKNNGNYIFDLYNNREELIVEVPDTYMNICNKKISPLIMLIGSVFILIGMKMKLFNSK